MQTIRISWTRCAHSHTCSTICKQQLEASEPRAGRLHLSMPSFPAALRRPVSGRQHSAVLSWAVHTVPPKALKCSVLCSLPIVLCHLAMARGSDQRPWQCFKRCTCALQLDRDSIAIEPDIPLYDLQDTMEAVGVPLEPEMPLLRALEVSGPDGLLHRARSALLL